MKKLIKVYPDFMSSGFWDKNGAAISPNELTGIPKVHLIAIENWHLMWEKFATYIPLGLGFEGSLEFREQWYELGKSLVDELNKVAPDEYTFEYNVGVYDYLNREEYVKDMDLE